MKLGYARAAPEEQNFARQLEALRAAGVDRIYEDKDVPGAAVIRPAYREMLRAAQPGDEIIVWRLDRLSHSLATLIAELQSIGGRGVVFRSLAEGIETESAAGSFFFKMVDSFAQFGRNVRDQRTNAEAAVDRREVRKPGRPPAISDELWSQVRGLMGGDPPLSPAGAAKLLGISRQAVHKRLKAEVAGE